MKGLNVKDSTILTKVDGNIKTVEELGSKVVSFWEKLMSSSKLILIAYFFICLEWVRMG